MRTIIPKLLLVAVILTISHVSAADKAKPLKIYILAGQSNMQGQASLTTIEAIRHDPKTKDLSDDMMDANGKPVILDTVYMSYRGGNTKPIHKFGKMTAGYGGVAKGTHMGPEFTFGIYMSKVIKDPILVIKACWGGKNLHTQFRPPSADPEKGAGEYYKKIIAYVKDTLSDIKKVYPEYNETAGYTIDGFVWFQGYNDLIDKKTYPNRNNPGGYKQYSEYLAHFIRDVRNAFSAPNMKFVIGVLGINGVDASTQKMPTDNSASTYVFQTAMAAPAAMPEFKGNVTAVYTGKYWDHLMLEAMKKQRRIEKEARKKAKEKGRLNREEMGHFIAKALEDGLTDAERGILEGKSDGSYHYLGSAKTYGLIGRAFAEAMLELEELNQK